MKKFCLIILLFLLSKNTIAQETVAVLDFESVGVSNDEAKALSNRFSSEFLSVSKGKYILVERQQMGDILKEQGLQQSGCVSSECAVEVGAALGASFIITGSISKVGTIYSINAKLIDVESSEILQSINHDQIGDVGVFLTRGMKAAASKLINLEMVNDTSLLEDQSNNIILEPKERAVRKPINKTILWTSVAIAGGGLTYLLISDKKDSSPETGSISVTIDIP